MKRHIPAALVVAAALCVGCQKASDEDHFAEGAFPPTISDMEYHSEAWTRSDCLVCHETGKDHDEQNRQFEQTREQRPPAGVRDTAGTEHALHDELVGTPEIETQQWNASEQSGPWHARIIDRPDEADHVRRYV